MTINKTLSELKRGQQAVVTELKLMDRIRRRLQDIGLIEGTKIQCVGKSPLGDPIAYLIKGSVIALRVEETSRIMVKISE